MPRLMSERDRQLNAVKNLVKNHFLPKDVAEASVYAAGWWDPNLCLNWARHYRQDKGLIKTNSKRFLRELGQKDEGTAKPDDADTLKSTDKATKFGEKIRKRDAKTLERIIISDKIERLLYEYHKSCDKLAALETKEMAVKNLIEFFQIEEKIATAAVQAEVLDPEKCLKWAQEYSNEATDELVWEYHADAGEIYSLQSKQKVVDELESKYQIENDVAIAAVQCDFAEFETDIDRCLQWIQKLKNEASYLAGMIEKLANDDCPDFIIEKAKKFDLSCRDLADFEKSEAAVRNLTKVHNVDPKVATAAVQHELLVQQLNRASENPVHNADLKVATAALQTIGHELLEQQLNWADANCYDVKTVNELFGEYVIQRSFLIELKKKVTIVKNLSLKFQIDERFVKAFMTISGDKNSENFLSWISNLAAKDVASVTKSFDTQSKFQDLEADFDVGSQELHRLEEKENMVSLLIKECKVPTEIAKASVQRCGIISLLQCKTWIEKYKSDHNIVKISVLEYKREHELFADLKAKDVMMTSLIEKDRLNTNLAKAAVQLKGPDIGSCKDWINSVLEKNFQSEHCKSQKGDVAQFLVKDMKYRWHLVTAAVHRCGDKSLDDCLQWIDRNLYRREVVGEAAWEYRFWNTVEQLGLHKSIETYDFGDKPVTSLEHTLSFLTEVYRFSPILAQAAVSAQGWGISNIQKCKEWAEVNRENYSEIYKFHNCLEERLKKEIESSFNKKMKQKAIQRKWIDEKGGIIELFGCVVSFPPNAVYSEVEIEISVDSNPEKFPKSCSKIPITPILGCKPQMKFQKPVKIKMQTYYSAKSDEKIPGKVLCKKNREDNWDSIENVTIIDENCITFEVWHFCGYNVAVSDENAAVGTYRLLNDVYIHRVTAQIVSAFTKDEKTQSDLKKSLREQGFIEFLPVTNEMSEPIGINVDLKLECIEPEGTMIAEGMPRSSFRITREFLKSTKYAVYFRMNPRPRGPDEDIDVLYRVIVDIEERPFPLLAKWPINLPDMTNAITIHTGPSYIRANQMATGSASIHVQDSTSVVSGAFDDDEQ